VGTCPLYNAPVPTGTALRDVRDQLFDAAERVLLREGPNGLTSRAVTTEAGVAKGVLHRHFSDFDSFLAELVEDRIARLEPPRAGTLTDALLAVFGGVGREIVGLVTSRDALRARLRESTPIGMPFLTQATDMVAGYLAADGVPRPHTTAMMLIGTAHLQFAGRDRAPDRDEVQALVTAVLEQ
jgi:AcrR family transcriptional regulator